MINLSYLTTWLPLLLVLLILLMFIILPFFKISSFKREGVFTYFFPILGIFHYWSAAFKAKGDMWADIKESSKKGTRNIKYMVSNVAGTPFFLLEDPQYIKEFLQKQNLYYHKSKIIEQMNFLVGNGLVTSEEEVWKRHRKIISNSFNFEFIKTNLNLIQSTARHFLMQTPCGEGNEYPAISKIQEITGEIVGKIFFSENLNTYTFEGKSFTLALAGIVTELSEAGKTPLFAIFGARIYKYPLLPSHRKLMRRVRSFRKVCFDIIRDRKAQPQQSSDLLASLLATQKCEDPEQRFSDEEIVNEFITFFIAGMDTTGHLLGMTLYVLTQHPEYLQILKEERDATYNKERHVTADTLHKMDFLHCLLKETLRFYTPAPIVFARVATKNHKLLDLDVRKGDIMTCNFLAPAFDEKYFENPLVFNPDRWKNSESKIDPYAFAPFSAGPRNCIGQHLAIIESKIIISEFLERFDFKLKEGYKLKMALRFLYEPENDVLLHLKLKA